MSRYIDADAIHWHDDGWACIRKDEYPSIDIVRCQDCKYWVYNFNGCSRSPSTEPWYATDFCNYGEKK